MDGLDDGGGIAGQHHVGYATRSQRKIVGKHGAWNCGMGSAAAPMGEGALAGRKYESTGAADAGGGRWSSVGVDGDGRAAEDQSREFFVHDSGQLSRPSVSDGLCIS